MPDLFYFNRHFHSMQAGIPVGTFLQKMETIFVKVVSCEKNWNMLLPICLICYNNGNENVKNSFQIKSREGERIWSYGRPF